MTTQEITDTRQNLKESVKESCCMTAFYIAALTKAQRIIEEETGESDRMISNEHDIAFRVYTLLLYACDVLKGI